MKIEFSSPIWKRRFFSLAIFLVALIIGWRLWQYYENEPWTRDGRIKANVIQVAPDVTGQVVKLNVHDNQEVEPGQVLFEIDRARFELALRQAIAAENTASTALQQALREAKRNDELKDLVSREMREQGQTRVDQARAALDQAKVARDTAQLDLDRTRVIAEVRGIVTNLDLHAGSYVTASKPVMALVDRDSYYVEGYFEETKLAGIRRGARATMTLMGDDSTLTGRVDSIARGITDRERTTGSNLLQNINPAFNWVRLVQRIPVRIKLDPVSEDVHLVAGQTVTIEISHEKSDDSKTASAADGKHPG